MDKSTPRATDKETKPSISGKTQQQSKTEENPSRTKMSEEQASTSGITQQQSKTEENPFKTKMSDEQPSTSNTKEEIIKRKSCDVQAGSIASQAECEVEGPPLAYTMKDFQPSGGYLPKHLRRRYYVDNKIESRAVELEICFPPPPEDVPLQGPSSRCQLQALGAESKGLEIPSQNKRARITEGECAPDRPESVQIYHHMRKLNTHVCKESRFVNLRFWPARFDTPLLLFSGLVLLILVISLYYYYKTYANH